MKICHFIQKLKGTRTHAHRKHYHVIRLFFPIKEGKQVRHAMWYKFTNRPWPDIIEFLVNKLVCITSFLQKNSSFSYHSWVLGRDSNQRPLPPIYEHLYHCENRAQNYQLLMMLGRGNTKSRRSRMYNVCMCAPGCLPISLAGPLPNSCIATESLPTSVFHIATAWNPRSAIRGIANTWERVQHILMFIYDGKRVSRSKLW